MALKYGPPSPFFERKPALNITLLAHTAIADGATDPIDETAFASRVGREYWDFDFHDGDILGEYAGRACYQAWNLPNPKTADNAGYLANIITQGHFSVLEHASATFYVEGVSRSLTHELVRHRHLSFSELSQRYVDVSKAAFVTPPAIKAAAKEVGGTVPESIEDATPDAFETYSDIYMGLTERGYSRKAAREAARCVLPNGTETKIVVTGNFRAWRDMLGKRWHVAADAEIREFAGEILQQLKTIAPNSFQDIPDEPYGS